MGSSTQRTLDRLAVAPGWLLGERMRYFRRSIDAPGWPEQLAIPTPELPPLELGQPVELTVDTVAGPLTVGALLAHDPPGPAPLLITHHGNAEQAFSFTRRAKNELNRALLVDGDPPPARVVVLRAALHDRPLRDHLDAAGDLRTWMAMLAASVVTIDAVIDALGDGRPTAVTGLSLGGWVTNLHRAYRGTAELYVPMLAGAHLGVQMLDSTYRHMVSTRARADAGRVRALLDFEEAFTARTGSRLVPLLARYDGYARPEDQQADYGEVEISWLPTGHLGAVMARDRLRAHVLDALGALDASDTAGVPSNTADAPSNAAGAPNNAPDQHPTTR